MEPLDTILVIDDDRVQRLALRAHLEGMGLKVVEAASGPEGLETFRRERPDLVLLDLNMPGMDGFAVCESLCSLGEGEGTPVIVISGLLGTSQKVKAFHAGAVDSLAKPIQFEELECRLRTHLAIRRQDIALRESRDTLRRTLHDTSAMNRNLLGLNEKLRHAEEVKTRFLSLMRNEINSPLSDILGLADQITQPTVPLDLARKLAASIKDEAFRLDCQIHNVFLAAEVEAGDACPYITRVDVASVLGDLEESFGPSARAKGLDLVVRGEGSLTAFPTDGAKLHHILANLLANAIQFSDRPGTVEVLAEVEQDRLTLEVADHGPGLTEAERRALFEPFTLASGPAPVHHGQHLGLPVVKALVDLLDGALHLETDPGRGTTFRIALPRAPENEGADEFGGNMLIFDDPQEF